MTRFVIIGAGEAGTRAALNLKGKGDVILIGEEPHWPYERPPLSKPGTDGVPLKPIATEEALGHVEFRPGTKAVEIDRQAKLVHLAEGDAIPYDSLLLATGSAPRTLPCEGGENALMLRRFDDAEEIFERAASAKRAVVIGAGLIGLEFAAVLRQKEIDVTVLEAAPRALGRALSPAMAEALVKKHCSEGVAFRFDARISHVSPDAVHLADGERLEADLIVAAIGVAPNTALAEAAGLACANGILVGKTLATDDPAIFAAGDCACLDHPLYGPARFEAWRVAVEMGAAAANAMSGTEVDFAPLPWFWSDQYDLGLQMAGFHNPKHRSIERTDGRTRIVFELDDAGCLLAAVGLGPGNAVAKDIKLAERLIQAGACLDPVQLGDPGVPMKKLMRDASALQSEALS